jgi:glucose dehydrogenase
MTIGRRFSARLLAGSALCALVGTSIPALAAETTYERLLNASAEPQNWLMRMGNYSNWNHSTLNEINRNNVANLKVKFMFSLGDAARPAKAAQYFTPIVEDGFMYVGNQYHQYWKLDVRDGKPKVVWKHDAKVSTGGKSGHSVTLLGNNLYYNVGSENANPRLVALDKNSGEVVFETSTNIPEAPNQGSVSAPLAVKDKIIIGTAGKNETGRGVVAAYSADAGKLRSRASPARRPGPIRARWRLAAVASGPSRRSIRRPISPFSAPAIRCTCSIRRGGRATISTPARSLRSISIPGS